MLLLWKIQYKILHGTLHILYNYIFCAASFCAKCRWLLFVTFPESCLLHSWWLSAFSALRCSSSYCSVLITELYALHCSLCFCLHASINSCRRVCHIQKHWFCYRVYTRWTRFCLIIGYCCRLLKLLWSIHERSEFVRLLLAFTCCKQYVWRGFDTPVHCVF